MVLTLFIIASATFFLLAAVPGDPLADRADKLPENIRQNMYHKYGLDKPVLERYVITMRGMLQGDFGESVRMPGYDIQRLLSETLAPSARLGLQTILLGVGLGLLLGVLAAMCKGTWLDHAIVFFSVLMISVPTLVFGLLLQKYVAGELGLFPIIGWPKGLYGPAHAERVLQLRGHLLPPAEDLHAGRHQPGLCVGRPGKGPQ